MIRDTFITVLSIYSLIGSTIAQTCKGQSCAIAALSGSTNESFDSLVEAKGSAPKGSNTKGKECITKYYKQLGLKAPKTPLKRDVSPVTPTDYTKRQSKGLSHIEVRQGCTPYINLFGRGTTEAGTMGGTVGPKLAKALSSGAPGKWSSVGVKYSADINGINCIGFPGGIKCVEQLAALAAKCPNSQFVLSGYSQGAMVARICTAYSKDDVKKRIKAIIAVGDPFNGASVKGFPAEGIRTVCNAGDGVCNGQFSISASHLSYSASGINAAAKWANGRMGK